MKIYYELLIIYFQPFYYEISTLPPHRHTAPNPFKHTAPKPATLCPMHIINSQRHHNPVRDAIHITKSGTVCSFNIVTDAYDPALRHVAHRDAIQIIPTLQGRWNAPYLATPITDIHIRANRIDSGNALQGIFCMDGLLREVVVERNRITTASAHYVTLGGLLSGEIHQNHDRWGRLCPVLLEPLRIGGNPVDPVSGLPMGSVWVLSFRSPAYAYAPLREVVIDRCHPACRDYRTQPRRRPGDTYLLDFDLEGFWAALEGTQTSPAAAQTLARRYGTAA